MIWKILLGLAIAGTTIWGMKVPPAEGFMNPDLARILFWHLPNAFITVAFVIAGTVASIRTLKSRGNAMQDLKAVAFNELALVFALITMATGILFSKVQWGEWWSWDPRQTSFLFVLLILFAYFALRSAFADSAKRAVNSAAYCVAAFIPIVFLVFVLPRMPQVQSLHPSNTITSGGLKGDYWNVVLANFILFLIVGIWLYRMRVRAGEIEHSWENRNGKLDDGGDRAATGVVRPLSVSNDGGP